MPRLSITHTPRPPEQYHPDRAPPCTRTGRRFETLAEARAEDLKRARLIRRTCRTAEVPFNRAAALEVADRLEQSGRGTAEQHTMASKVYMGRMRFRIGGALWRLSMGSEPKTRTVTPPQWVFDADYLAEVDPRKLLAAIKSVLNRQGARKVGGALIAAIHGEFDPVARKFHLHVHGLAMGAMIAVVRSLKKVPKYRFRRSRGDKRGKVRVCRKQLNTLPYPLTYIFQSSWPSRWRGMVSGKEVKSSRRRRIPEPYHTQLLLWLDKWKLKDTTLMMGMSVGRNGLVTR